jgi:HSP20 family protein
MWLPSRQESLAVRDGRHHGAGRDEARLRPAGRRSATCQQPEVTMAMLPPRRRRAGRNLTMYDPTREFEDVYTRMGQLMNMALGDLPAAVDVPWAPLADLSETDGAYVVRAELPGVNKDQVNVEIQDRELVISGEIPEPESDEGRRHRSTRRTGRFEYRADLPGDINPEQVSARLSDGVLTVMVPKSEGAKPRRIEVSG